MEPCAGRHLPAPTATNARVFCSKLEAELVAVDGYYITAEMLESRLHGRGAQAWLDGDMLMVAPLD